MNASTTPDTVASVEAHRDATRTPPWAHYAAARVYRWGLGRELTRSEYLAAIADVMARPASGEPR